MKNELIKILAKRILSSVIILFLLITFIFFLLRISPGDPAQKYVSPKLSPELALKVRESFNLNGNVFDQYKAFVINLFKGDFGISYDRRQPVLAVIKPALFFTIKFALISFIIQIFFGFVLALISVKNKNGALDKTFSKLSLTVYSIPSFVIGVILLFFFAGMLDWFPTSGIIDYGFESMGFFEKLLNYANHLALPLITLSLGGIAVFYKYLRDSLEEVYKKTFIINLRSYGIKESEITIKHVIPNAINPLISIAGVELGILLSGSLITEVIFGLPGMGRLTMGAISDRDYPLVIGCTFTAGFLVILSNFAADIIKAKLDKRVSKEILN